MTYGAHDIEPTLHGQVLGLVALGKFPCYWDAKLSSVGIKDAADAMLLAEKNGRIGERYIITDKLLHLKDIFQLAADHGVAKRRLFKIPMFLMYVTAILYQAVALITGKDTGFTFVSLRLSFKAKDFDNSKAIDELKWHPRPVEESIIEAAKWFTSDACTCSNLNLKNL